MTVYARPGAEGSLMSSAARYDNFIGGEWTPPAGGDYLENPTPVTGQTFTEAARSTDADIDKALDAAHGGVGQDGAARAGGDPEQDRRPYRGEPGVDRAG